MSLADKDSKGGLDGPIARGFRRTTFRTSRRGLLGCPWSLTAGKYYEYRGLCQVFFALSSLIFFKISPTPSLKKRGVWFSC